MTDGFGSAWQYVTMGAPVIVFSDRLDNGMVIGFDDGKTAFFSAQLLYATMAQAQMMPVEPDDSGTAEERRADAGENVEPERGDNGSGAAD
jgi:hypothetical protein